MVPTRWLAPRATFQDLNRFALAASVVVACAGLPALAAYIAQMGRQPADADCGVGRLRPTAGIFRDATARGVSRAVRWETGVNRLFGASQTARVSQRGSS
ncbi:MAG: hypothetical protein Fur0019_19470 [Tibeticola sp.]